MVALIKKLIKDINGQVAIIFIFVILIIIGFTGLAIDSWLVIYSKQNLQDAVDLAAISAMQESSVNHGQVVSTAIGIVHKNAKKSQGVNVKVAYPYMENVNKVEVSAKKDVDLVFLSILGIKKASISSRAVAEATYITEIGYTDKALDYTVFSGSTSANLVIKGNGSVVNGNVHANNTIEIQGAQHTINGNVTSASDVKPGSCTINGTKTQKIPVVPMPVFGFEELAKNAVKVYDSDVILNDIDIDGIWLVNGNLKLNGGRITGKGVILARGSIDMPSNNVQYSSSNDLLALYSLGDITLSCTRNRIQGILYAPNGQIKISGSYNTFYGALIANEIYWVTKDITINGDYDIRAPQAFTIKKTSCRLVE